MFKSAYIITKPMQYINATNIFDKNIKDCLIINEFSGVEAFMQNVSKNTDYWNNIILFDSRTSAYKYLIKHRGDYDKLFLDMDQGLVTTLYLFRLLPLKIYTYEEGYASYIKLRDDKKIKEKLKIMLYYLFGCRNWFGGCVFTKGIYLYHPNVLKNLIPEVHKNLYCFKKPFLEHVNELKELSYLSEGIDIDKFRDKDVLIYLTGWTLNPKIPMMTKQYGDYYKILKPHPHIKNISENMCSFDMKINNAMPAELLIVLISKYCNNLLIIHENSTSLLYLEDIKYSAINMEEIYSVPIYNTILDEIRNDTSVF